MGFRGTASTSWLFTACPIQLYCYVFLLLLLASSTLSFAFGPFSVHTSSSASTMLVLHPIRQNHHQWHCWSTTGIPLGVSQFELFIPFRLASSIFISQYQALITTFGFGSGASGQQQQQQRILRRIYPASGNQSVVYERMQYYKTSGIEFFNWLNSCPCTHATTVVAVSPKNSKTDEHMNLISIHGAYEHFYLLTNPSPSAMQTHTLSQLTKGVGWWSFLQNWI